MQMNFDADCDMASLIARHEAANVTNNANVFSFII